VRIVELPGLEPAGDVSDWLRFDPSGARLVKECAKAPLWEKGRKDRETISALAALERLAYGRARKEAAADLGVTATELDKIVAEARGREGEEPERWRLEPWETPIATAELLRELAELYPRYVVLPRHGEIAMALWVLHAWAIEAAYVTPFLMFVSPEMRCGKSTALALLYRTGPRTAMASNISAAAVYRYIEALRPTLLLDEAETFVGDNEELRGVLNSGHTRDTAHVIRLVAKGDDFAPKEFSTWVPKALASIGKLAETLRDRAILLPMKRRKADETVAKLRVEDTAEFADRLADGLRIMSRG
jgi:putative DNA primase/helicase